VRRFAAFAATCLAVIAACLAALWLLFRQPAERNALLVGAALAFAVQLAAFAIAAALSRHNIMAGWGAGALLRFATLAAYALVVVPQLGFPLTAALVSVALFLVLSTMVEPFFLKP
jgi:hypothetical protein